MRTAIAGRAVCASSAIPKAYLSTAGCCPRGSPGGALAPGCDKMHVRTVANLRRRKRGPPRAERPGRIIAPHGSALGQAL